MYLLFLNLLFFNSCIYYFLFIYFEFLYLLFLNSCIYYFVFIIFEFMLYLLFLIHVETIKLFLF